MNGNRLLVVFLLLFLVLPLGYALTASMGNARAVVRIEASPEDPAVLHRTILVNNKNNISTLVSLSVDEKFEKFIEIIDKEVTLEPGESKQARYIVTMDRGGTFNIPINVGFSPADPDVKDNNVGLVSTLVVVSEGPEIEDEDFEDTDVHDVPELEEDVIEDGEITEEGNTGVTVTPSSRPLSSNEEKVTVPTSTIIGIAIVVVIVALGLTAFFIIQKLR